MPTTDGDVTHEIFEETLGGKTKMRARITASGFTVSGPLRVQRTTAESDLAKMLEAYNANGVKEAQRIQPELFRVRERRL